MNGVQQAALFLIACGGVYIFLSMGFTGFVVLRLKRVTSGAYAAMYGVMTVGLPILLVGLALFGLGVLL